MTVVLTTAGIGRAPCVAALAETVTYSLPGARVIWAVPSAVRTEQLPTLRSPGGKVQVERICVPHDGANEAADGECAFPGALDLARKVLAEGEDEALLWVHSDVALFPPIAEWIANLGAAAGLLVALLIEPETEVSRERPPAGELAALREGVFTPRLLFLRRCVESDRFLRWWARRLRLDMSVTGAAPRGSWLSLAPALFPGLRVARSPGLGVSRDNLHERALGWRTPGEVTANGEDLASFDFAGFDDGSLGTAFERSGCDSAIRDALLGMHRERLRHGGASA